MNIPKARQILTIMSTDRSSAFLPDERDAMRLGEEALKRIQDYRNRGMTMECFILPGETKD